MTKHKGTRRVRPIRAKRRKKQEPAPAPPLDLLPHHADLIAASAISAEVAHARGYRSIQKKAELEQLGFGRNQCRVPALLIPVYGRAGAIVTYQLRPDVPRIKDGKPLKYETPRNSHMALDVPPGALPSIGDPTIPLFITEGARKADAAVSRGLCCIALLGVWNFRGTNELGGKTVIADWEYVALNDRTTYIVFDSDVMLKPGVAAALARLKAFLVGRGCRVSLIYLPAGPGGTKVGLDDYFAAGHSVDDLLALATQELRHDSPSETELPYKSTPSGIVWLKHTLDGGVPTPLTNFDARIIGDVIEDDGVDVRRVFEIEANLNGRTSQFLVRPTQFNGMGWHVENLGASAVIYPGLALKDHARAAIQILSGEVPERHVYTHTGWCQVGNDWVYMHGGGGIGPSGTVDGISVCLPWSLRNFVLPETPTCSELTNAVRASLSFLDIAPDPISVPVLAGIYRAILGDTDFSIGIFGPTQVGKTELAALAQQHFGATMDARHLPTAWSSTGNALEGVAFAAKDVLIVADDFAPTGSQVDIARMHRDADRVLRAQGNRSGRLRMRPDSTIAPERPPRGLILMTGEDIPRGQSLRARQLILELAPDGTNWELVTTAQQIASAGTYARAVAGYVRWLSVHYQALRVDIRRNVAALRSKALRSGQHRRTPEIVANLALGMGYFLAFSQSMGAITRAETETLWVRCWHALGEAARRQGQFQMASDPTIRFFELIGAAVASGRAHVATPGGESPDNPGSWGWRASGGGGNDQREAWQPGGDRIGWVDDADLYLEPDASFVVAQRFGRDTGEALPISLRTLKKRLNERGFLASVDGQRETLTVRRTLECRRRDVLHIHAATLSDYSIPEPDQPDQSDNPPRVMLVGLVGFLSDISSETNGRGGDTDEWEQV